MVQENSSSEEVRWDEITWRRGRGIGRGGGGGEGKRERENVQTTRKSSGLGAL